MLIWLLQLLPVFYLFYHETKSLKGFHIEEFEIIAQLHIGMFKLKDFAEKLLRVAPGKHHIDKTRPITALLIGGYGRLGNNIIQVLNALSIATDLSIKKIYIPTTYWFINTSLVIDGFVFLKNGNSNGENVFSDNFYFPYKEIDYNQNRTLHVLRKHFQSQIPKLNLSDDKLVIHIRSGDLFTHNTPTDNYSQPSYCFFSQVIDKFNKKNVEVFAEDRKNPVTNELEKQKIKITHADLLTTVSNIFYARNVAFGYGTFAVSICRISTIPKNVYVFGNMKYHIGYQDPRFKVYINEMSKDFKAIMYPWRNSDKQRKCLVNCMCTNTWTIQKQEFINNNYRVVM